jgi:hypothetical protein
VNRREQKMGVVMTAASTKPLGINSDQPAIQGNPQAMLLSFTTAKHMSLNIGAVAYLINYFVRNMAWS